MNEKENKKVVPSHIGIIPDGNRRWAEERNLSSLEGHEKGYNKLRRAIDWFFSRGVKIISVYTFSTENWERSRDEVNYLMKLLRSALEREIDEATKNDYKILISGRIQELPGDLPEICVEAIEKTKNGQKGTINFCLNYGGRAEIVDAIKKMINNKIDPEQVHEGMVKKYLYNSDLPDPDVIVRTSGEQRVSGFQLWEGAYSELVFLNKYWPDFEQSDVEYILEEYAERKRRFGGDQH